jgi:hypothetical protein
MSTPPHILGRISKTRAEVSLEMNCDALRLGIEQPTIIAALILMSGRNID